MTTDIQDSHSENDSFMREQNPMNDDNYNNATVLSQRQVAEERAAMQYEFKCEQELHKAVEEFQEEKGSIEQAISERDNVQLTAIRELK